MEKLETHIYPKGCTPPLIGYRGRTSDPQKREFVVEAKFGDEDEGGDGEVQFVIWSGYNYHTLPLRLDTAEELGKALVRIVQNLRSGRTQKWYAALDAFDALMEEKS